MDLTEEFDFDALVNEAERLVIEELGRQLEELDWIPRTQESVLDMAALALNHVPPFYHVSLMGRLYAESIRRTRYAETIRKAVRDAIKRVATNPSA